MTEFLEEYRLLGLAIGLCTFLIIGVFHPIVIKCHYYFGVGCRWWFIIAGILACVLSVIVTDLFLSVIFGVLAFSCFWSVREINEQEVRVARGWFPANPERKKK